ncbi:hypothetical protein TSUD_292620 [Trifolium subterraneum]|uniref:Uncharacterized protein n=1 Tax=Trifolium subterraneum TaxID=3900 RepID=A0A2Z6P4R2_TRISU|nr:hypothetical protein TSUD_292620 [Trifolium subterraneum]
MHMFKISRNPIHQFKEINAQIQGNSGKHTHVHSPECTAVRLKLADPADEDNHMINELVNFSYVKVLQIESQNMLHCMKF